MAVFVRRGYLYLDFYCYTPDRRKIRCQESTGLKDSKRNREILQSKDKAIKYESARGQFDYLHFFPNGARAHLFRKPTGEGLIFSEWWDQWLSEKSIRENTARGWNSSYRIHIRPYFGNMLIQVIDDHEILVFRKSLEAKGLKESSINDKIIKPLCMCLYRAQRRGLIETYPCRDIKKLAEQPVDINPFSYDELRHILEVLKDKKRLMYHDLIIIWSRTGLRPGEIYALKWRNIDFYNRKILIRETRLHSGSEGPPKTSHSIRDVDMRAPVFEALKRQEARTGLHDGHIFLTEAAKPFSDAFMRKKFRFLLKLAGLNYRPPKQMRHTFATLHLAAGENISWVSRMLGHASGDVTWKRYNRYVPNLTREDGSAFEKVMNGDSRGQKGDNQVTR